MSGALREQPPGAQWAWLWPGNGEEGQVQSFKELC